MHQLSERVTYTCMNFPCGYRLTHNIEVHAVQNCQEKAIFYIVQEVKYMHFSEIMTVLKHLWYKHPQKPAVRVKQKELKKGKILLAAKQSSHKQRVNIKLAVKKNPDKILGSCPRKTCWVHDQSALDAPPPFILPLTKPITEQLLGVGW